MSFKEANKILTTDYATPEEEKAAHMSYAKAIRVPGPDRNKVLFIARGYSESAARKLLALVEKLRLTDYYIVLIPEYSQHTRHLREEDDKQGGNPYARQANESRNLIQDQCAKGIAHSIRDMFASSDDNESKEKLPLVIAGLSVGGSVCSYLSDEICSDQNKFPLKLTKLLVHAPDPLLVMVTGITVPVTLCWNIKDKVVPFQFWEENYKMLQPAEFIVMPGEDHEFQEQTLSRFLGL